MASPQVPRPPTTSHPSLESNSNVQISSLSVTLKVEDLKFIPEKDVYEIEIGDAFYISSNPQKKSIKIHVSTSKMKKINKEIADEDMDKLLEEIEDQNEFIHNRDKIILALQPRNIKKEWNKISTKHPATFSPTTPIPDQASQLQSSDSLSVNSMDPVIYEETCNLYIGQCVIIKRILFLMKYYGLWRQYKTKQLQDNNGKQARKDFESMTEFLHALGRYNKIDLMNDYLHVRKCHFSNDLIGYFRDKLDDCNSNNSKCLCIKRNNKSREIYSYSTKMRNDLYFINAAQIKQGSLHEIREINLQHDLDVIHCSFLHNAFSETLNKYISEVDAKPDNADNDEKEAQTENIYDEFGIYFDYWKENRKDFCKFHYPNLKTELLNNNLYSISWNDFNSMYEAAKDFLRTQFAKYTMNAKREFDAMKGAVKYGANIGIDHIISILSYTNYKKLQSVFIKKGCKKLTLREKKQEVMLRNSEIANWCRLLKESIYYYGDLLGDGERLYHGINRKLMFQRVAKKFNLPMSTTTSYMVANKFASSRGICLLFGKMFALEENNLYLDVSFLSDYPNESERVIYGGRLGFVDIIYDSVSHCECVMSLRLYQKLIDGDWFTKNENLFQKKYQNEIINMITNMMSKNKKKVNANYDAYMQRLFECIVENVGFGTKTIWINQEECTKLTGELNKLFFQTFLPFLRKYYKIRMKYCSLMNMKIKRDALLSSSRQYQLYSAEYKYKYMENDEMELHFRCYKQFDQVKNQYVLMAKFEAKTLPKTISSVKMYGGLWFPQIAFDRWDYCTLSHSKLSQGCPLFSLDKIKEIDTLKIEICFQLYRVYDQYGKRLKI